ncbi:MAG: hypothetical protein IIZ78_24050 [Clostridiales bacterium]|nr:hypothetical protein [Clostridiales bacterium]
MAIAFLFKINNTDVTGHVVRNTYKVNNLPVYKEYEDANGVTHKRYIRHKVRGTLQMVFRDVDDYLTFKALIDENISASNFTVPATLYDNISGTHLTVNVFLDYDPTVMQTDGGFKEYMKVIDMTIEER